MDELLLNLLQISIEVAFAQVYLFIGFVKIFVESLFRFRYVFISSGSLFPDD